MTHVPDTESAFTAIAAAMLHRRIPKETIARLIYLIDWKSAIEDARQVSGIVWCTDGAGKMDFSSVVQRLDDVRESMRSVRTMSDMMRNMVPESYVPAAARAAYDHVISKTTGMNRIDLEVLVRSTYPCITANAAGVTLDLPHLAMRYADVLSAVET